MIQHKVDDFESLWNKLCEKYKLNPNCKNGLKIGISDSGFKGESDRVVSIVEIPKIPYEPTYKEVCKIVWAKFIIEQNSYPDGKGATMLLNLFQDIHDNVKSKSRLEMRK